MFRRIRCFEPHTPSASVRGAADLSAPGTPPLGLRPMSDAIPQRPRPRRARARAAAPRRHGDLRGGVRPARRALVSDRPARVGAPLDGRWNARPRGHPTRGRARQARSPTPDALARFSSSVSQTLDCSRTASSTTRPPPRRDRRRVTTRGARPLDPLPALPLHLQRARGVLSAVRHHRVQRVGSRAGAGAAAARRGGRVAARACVHAAARLGELSRVRGEARRRRLRITSTKRASAACTPRAGRRRSPSDAICFRRASSTTARPCACRPWWSARAWCAAQAAPRAIRSSPTGRAPAATSRRRSSSRCCPSASRSRVTRPARAPSSCAGISRNATRPPSDLAAWLWSVAEALEGDGAALPEATRVMPIEREGFARWLRALHVVNAQRVAAESLAWRGDNDTVQQAFAALREILEGAHGRRRAASGADHHRGAGRKPHRRRRCISGRRRTRNQWVAGRPLATQLRNLAMRVVLRPARVQRCRPRGDARGPGLRRARRARRSDVPRARPPRRRTHPGVIGVRRLFAATTLLGSALLFAIEPAVARMLLPATGSVPALWNTCVVFFQLSPPRGLRLVALAPLGASAIARWASSR